LERGELWGLYVVDRDPFTVWSPELQRKVMELPFTVYQGSQANHYAHAARWVLPTATWAEEEGTYCNFLGQVQRCHAAVPPLGESKPDWAIWRDILKFLGVDCPYQDAAAIFQQICLEPEFETLSWEELRAQGRALRRSSTSLKVGA
jgi:predicted molibdopterin-dependent oxidoreductase YjgC